MLENLIVGVYKGKHWRNSYRLLVYWHYI